MAELSPPLSPRGRRIFLAAILLYAAITIPLAVHKGDDIGVEFSQGDAFLRGLPVYAAPPLQGAWWPPFATVLVAPFALIARLSVPLGKTCWAAFSVLCLAWSLARASRFGARAMVLAVLAVAMPLQINFQHLNINTPLLALAIAAADDWERHETRAGIWVALATALKVFPGLLILLFAWRRRWRGFGVAALGAVLLTYASMLPYGVVGAAQAVGRWIALDLRGTSYQGAQVAELGMQKLSRLVYALDGNLVVVVIAHALLLALVCRGLNAEWGMPNAESPSADSALRIPRSAFQAWRDVGVVLTAACLLSPVGWQHTFTLVYPLWVAVLALREPHSRIRIGLIGLAGVLTSGYLSKVPWPSGLAWVAGHNDTVGSLLLLVLIATPPPLRPAPAAVPPLAT